MTRTELVAATPQQIAANYANAYKAIRENNEAISGFSEVNGPNYLQFRALVTNIEMIVPAKRYEIFPDGTIIENEGDDIIRG